MNSANQMAPAEKSHEGWGPFLELAAREVFELMLGCHLKVQTAPADAVLNITSMVGMAGQLCGVMSVRCNGKSATLMASKMLGIAVDKVGAEMSDALGEICNMVAGNFKNKIPGLGDGCMLSPPTIISGNDYSMYSMADKPALELAMLFEEMPIIISLQIHS